MTELYGKEELKRQPSDRSTDIEAMGGEQKLMQMGINQHKMKQ